MIDVELLKRRLEERGEEKVRELLTVNGFTSQEMPIVLEWLSSKDRKKSQEIMDETLSIKKRAELAAWVSAIAALISASAVIASWLR